VITNKVEYLILTLTDLATHARDQYVLSREVAERQGIPVKYMPQIMAILTKKGWVEAVRGAKGGVKLKVDPAQITVQDVIDISDNPFLIKPCILEGFQCPKKASCPLQEVWRRAQSNVEKVMKSTTLADLVR